MSLSSHHLGGKKNHFAEHTKVCYNAQNKFPCYEHFELKKNSSLFSHFVLVFLLTFFHTIKFISSLLSPRKNSLKIAKLNLSFHKARYLIETIFNLFFICFYLFPFVASLYFLFINYFVNFYFRFIAIIAVGSLAIGDKIFRTYIKG